MKYSDIFTTTEQGQEFDDEYINDLAGCYQKGDDIPPIIVQEDGEIIEGNHRFLASLKAGIKAKYIVVKDELCCTLRKEGYRNDEIEDYVILRQR